MAKNPVRRASSICPQCGCELDERSDGMLDCSNCGFEKKGNGKPAESTEDIDDGV